MIRKYCDICEKEITSDNTVTSSAGYPRLSTAIYSPDKAVKLTVELIQYKNDTSNTGDFCKYCIIDAFNKFDDRTRPS